MTDPIKGYTTGDSEHDWRATVHRIVDAAMTCGADARVVGNTVNVSGTPAEVARVVNALPRKLRHPNGWPYSETVPIMKVTWEKP